MNNGQVEFGAAVEARAFLRQTVASCGGRAEREGGMGAGAGAGAGAGKGTISGCVSGP